MGEKNKIKSQISVAIKKGDLIDKAFCLILMKLGYSNDRLQTLEIRNKKYLYVKKHYGNLINKYSNMPMCSDEKEKKIWILWLQGIDNAPDIVKRCYESVLKFKGEYKVVLLNRHNIKEYVELPNYIYEKWNAGKISNTHIADIIRTDLMVRHGGIWLDATVLLTGEIPSYILNADFFVYKRSNARDKTILANNWLISSKKNTRLMLCVREILFSYWKKEVKIRDYFLWQIIMTIAIEKYQEDWESILHVPDVLPEMMRWNIFKKISDNSYSEITAINSVHKLSYKIDLPDDVKGTIYEFILENKEFCV